MTHSGKRPFCWAAIVLASLALSVAGCGPSYPTTHPVSGTITYQGQPVPQGTIVFYPEEGRAAMSNIEADGSYRLTTFRPGDGALPGRHTVTITAIADSASGPASFEQEMDQGMLGRGQKGVRWLVPERYSKRDTTPLTAEVPVPDGTLDFDLAN